MPPRGWLGVARWMLGTSCEAYVTLWWRACQCTTAVLLVLLARQHDDETVTDYSHELAALVDWLERASPRHGTNRDGTLIDQLVENVRESLLRWELRKKTDSQPGASFIKIWDVDGWWSIETDGSKCRVRVLWPLRKSRQKTASCRCLR